MKSASPVVRALFAAMLLVGATAVLKWLAPDYIGIEWARRLGAALLAVVVLCYANAIPKSLVPLARLRCAPEREQAVRRFAGRSLVLGGLGYLLAALCAPLAAMHLIGGAVLALALAAALWRCIGAGRPTARG